MRRATIEPNLHTLYLAFINSLVDWPLKDLDVLQEAYTLINAILLATSPFNHFAAGSGLKNLLSLAIGLVYRPWPKTGVYLTLSCL